MLDIMKKTSLLFALFVGTYGCKHQNAGPTTGNVGIGTANPSAKFRYINRTTPKLHNRKNGCNFINPCKMDLY